MYKKITHHIVEEHFDHPIAAQLKKNIDKNKPMSAVDYMGRVLDPVTGKPMVDPLTGNFVYANTNVSKAKGYMKSYDFSSSQIEKNSIHCWSQLAWRIRNLIIGITSDSAEVDSLKTKLVTDIDNISGIVANCYGKDAAAQFKTLLVDVALALAGVIVQIKNDKDTTDAMKTLADTTKSLGDFLESASTLWPSTAVVDILTQVENSYIMQAISRMKKEWEAADSAADGAYNILVVKQDNGSSSFADIFSAGIIDCMEKKIQNEIYDVLDYMET
jgi:hypothetical protein